jgi:hypothetical protein
MMEYKDKLMMLNLKELKAFIKDYNLQMKIVMTKKKKEELIAEILKHTDYQNGKVIIKSHPIEGSIEAKPKDVKPKKEVMKGEPMKEIMKAKTNMKDEENLNRLIDMERYDFETREQAKIRLEREDKESKQRQMASLLNLFKSFSNKDEWKKSTKMEKEYLCGNFAMFQKMGLDIPKHLSDYHKRWCMKKK